MLKKLVNNTIVRLLSGVIIGLFVGPYLNDILLQVILSTKHILGQLILFLVPLIILGFIVSSIAKLDQKSSVIIGFSLAIAYISSVGAGLFSGSLGYTILPWLDIPSTAATGRALPEMLFKLDIPPIFDVMTSLVLALMIGLGILWTQSKPLEVAFDHFREIVLLLVNRVLVPLLPLYIACNFALLSYVGSIQSQLPIFLIVIIIVILAHIVWITILYTIAGLYAKKNPWEVLRHYGPTYLTALGTMSSAASLGVALQSAHKSKVLKPEITNFTIPFFSNVHLCGAMVTETFFVMTVSLVLYGHLPNVSTLILFVLLLGIFALGAPGVPGGALMASLGLITSMLDFDDTGIALVLTIFALQDSFGTACNIVGDGALSLMATAFHERQQKREAQ
ncbi:cation:dicarboxylase symporter family transporter [Myroides odoratimimus]|uniref:cation:dicarboxylate symporter family transporter n=1 Tax=Myroides odoratimimus TaxID=76832 RepID=UPI00103F942B|nr:cation:dicarboxylase symporter family transporter [Myroides odoratimimus]MCA4791765.1 cation:dicarboxylase symporter family transporter [Myroides odoratimimus]MCA4805690.1 cation:dicarboxylase symporter family transporter [Myroides odoratimimus]MCA4819026.1 cation:dicarboxylase symporter family transporter [Myroides odoratimimus]MDM1059133.1 cation:dicarboxylase symporter family transporter [Myroides odoratimimus]MDM1091779.1 cation:dicarboxylase symporter family transporter [Myroides odora